MIFALCSLLLLLAMLVWGALSLNKGLELRSFEQNLQDSTTQELDTTLVGQSFLSPRANLSAIQLQLSNFPALQSPGRIRLLSGDGLSGSPVYSASLASASFATNPYLTITFPPVASSAGQTYTLVLDSPGQPLKSLVSARYNSFDALSSGTMYTDAGPAPGDLTMTVGYHYGLETLWGDIVKTATGEIALILSWILLLLLPGSALLLWLPNSLTGGQRFLAAPAVSVLSIPIFLLVTRALGIRLGTVAIWLVLALCVVAIAVWWWRYRPRVDIKSVTRRDATFWTLLMGTCFATVAGRLLSLRDAYAGMGLDAYHHTLIAEMFVRAGGIPANYLPYAPLSSFTYHFGFHALTASVGWLSGRTSALDMMLLMPQAGQISTALAVLTLALLCWKAVGDRWVGLVAGALAGLVSIFPAFYVNWSRYTQGLGLMLLPISWLLLLEVLDRPHSEAAQSVTPTRISWQSARRQSGPYMLAVVGAAGLALSHYRIAIVYAAFVVLYLFYRLSVSLRAKEAIGELLLPFRRTGAVALLALAALLPWVLNLWSNFTTQFVNKSSTDTSEYYSLNQSVGPGLLSQPSITILFALSGVALAIMTWRILTGWRWRLPLSVAAAIVSVAPVLYININFFEQSGLLFPAFAWLLLEAVIVAALVWRAARPEALLLLPTLVWLLLGLWSNPYILPLRLPYSGYLDATTLATGAWLPACILSGYLLVALGRRLLAEGDNWGRMSQRAWRGSVAALMLAASIAGGLASLLSISSMIDLKPYVAKADADALLWMRDNLPEGSYVLANPFSFPWSKSSVQGSDAGLWVPLVTGGIRSSVPPVTAYNERALDPNYLQSLLDIVADEPLDANFASGTVGWETLKAAGVTHIYIGSRGGQLSIKNLLQNDRVQVVFHEDSVYLFKLR
ncbi:MAG: hypothetical protein IVW55_08380 [Chloroflexi bacterium]|nr:hypothetical protein [Chloroflexota bacterium]